MGRIARSDTPEHGVKRIDEIAHAVALKRLRDARIDQRGLEPAGLARDAATIRNRIVVRMHQDAAVERGVGVDQADQAPVMIVHALQEMPEPAISAAEAVGSRLRGAAVQPEQGAHVVESSEVVAAAADEHRREAASISTQRAGDPVLVLAIDVVEGLGAVHAVREDGVLLPLDDRPQIANQAAAGEGVPEPGISDRQDTRHHQHPLHRGFIPVCGHVAHLPPRSIHPRREAESHIPPPIGATRFQSR